MLFFFGGGPYCNSGRIYPQSPILIMKAPTVYTNPASRPARSVPFRDAQTSEGRGEIRAITVEKEAQLHFQVLQIVDSIGTS